MNKYLRKEIIRAALKDVLKYNYKELTQDDPDRIYFSIGNDIYFIRLWNVFKDKIVDYSLFKAVDNHGEEIVEGIIDLDNIY